MKTPFHKMFLWFIVFLIIAGPAQAKAKTETVAVQPLTTPLTILPGMPPCFDPQVEPFESLSDSALPGAAVAPGDEFWDDRFDVLGVSGYVYAVTASGDDVYIGGNFNAVGGLGTNGIARWNRTTGTWSALGEGIPGYVYAIAISGRYVYAGGMFNATGGYPSTPGTQSIARWDSVTHTWSALGEGIPGYVYTIAVVGDDLYVGGMFNAVGGYPSIDGTQSLARWNITTETWSAVGEGIPGYVYALAVDGDNLYVGGMFNAVGGYPSIPGTQSIARWNKTNKNWSALQEGVPGWVCAIAPDGGDLYVGGLFNAVGGYPSVPYTYNIAKWDGSAWSALGSGVGGYVNDIAIGADGVYVGGLFNTAGGKASRNFGHWNGNLPDPPDPPTLYDPYWDGRFGPEALGLNGSVNAIAVNGNDVYVGGDFTMAGGMSANHIARWDGSRWWALGSGTDYSVWAIAVRGSDVYVGGNFTYAGGVRVNYIARWDGSRWWALGSGVGVNGTFPVYAIAVSGNDVYVGGNFSSVGGVSAHSIARWDGSYWHALGDGVNHQTLSPEVFDIAVVGSDVYVGGVFTSAGGVSAHYIARWDGSYWHALGDGVNDIVNATAVSENGVYVGGKFTMAGGVSANHIARWDGSNWHPLGSGVNDTPVAIAVVGSDVYVGGVFTTAGGVSANHIARWDGSRWSALGSGSGTDIQAVWAIAVNGNDVYVGGGFTTAGGKPSYYFGIWHAGSTASPSGSIEGQVTGPGGSAVVGALVQVCPAAGGWCPWSGRTDSMGFYSAGHLRAGQYRVKVYSPASSSLRPDSTASITLSENGSLGGQDLRLRNYQPLPSGANLTPSQTGLLHVPRVSWSRQITLSAQGCPGGSASYQITQAGAVLRSGALTENPAGRYHAALAAFTPYYGDAEAGVTIRCPSSRAFAADTNYDFDLYIEPDHTVRTSSGLPVADATVTLYAFDAETGVFLPVPDGDAVMSPVNQANPDTTNASGSFGWDLSEGVYKIRAKKAGCVAPYNPAQSYVETAVLIVPSATVTDLDLLLDCGMDNVKIHLPLIQR